MNIGHQKEILKAVVKISSFWQLTNVHPQNCGDLLFSNLSAMAQAHGQLYCAGITPFMIRFILSDGAACQKKVFGLVKTAFN